MDNLDGIVKRLEAATTRLEKLSHQKPSLAPKLGSADGGAANHLSEEVPPTVKNYDDEVEHLLTNFYGICAKIGGDVVTMSDKIKAIFIEQRNFIWSAAGQKEPDNDQKVAKLAPIYKLNEEIIQFKDSKRNTTFFNHLSAMSDGIPVVAWINVKPTPVPYIKEMLDASMFFVNRVRKDFKDDPVHKDWVHAWCEIFHALQRYVKQFHTTGLVWNSSPGAAPSLSVSAKSSTGPRAPPPPPPIDLLANLQGKSTTAKPSGDFDRQKLFESINKGENITSSLKKVTPDMQTHKNLGLRAGTTVPANALPQSTTGAVKTQKPAAVKPPRLELENFKNWIVEYQDGAQNLEVKITDMKQTVYVYKCKNTVIQVKGKVNSVTIDSCQRTSVVFENLLSQFEIINSQSVQVQSMGTLPTVSIQKTDGCQVYLSKESANAEIITSKSSEMNVLVPNSDGEFIEFPIPEQFKTVYNANKNKIETTVSDIV